jgi:hypothetical protein
MREVARPDGKFLCIIERQVDDTAGNILIDSMTTVRNPDVNGNVQLTTELELGMRTAHIKSISETCSPVSTLITPYGGLIMTGCETCKEAPENPALVYQD